MAMAIPQIKTMEDNISVELTETISWWEKFLPSQRLLTGSRYTIAKRMMDLVVVGFALPFLLPLFASTSKCWRFSTRSAKL